MLNSRYTWKARTHSSAKNVLTLQQSSVNHVKLAILLNALHHVDDLAVDRNVLHEVAENHSHGANIIYFEIISRPSREILVLVNGSKHVPRMLVSDVCFNFSAPSNACDLKLLRCLPDTKCS